MLWTGRSFICCEFALLWRYMVKPVVALLHPGSTLDYCSHTFISRQVAKAARGQGWILKARRQLNVVSLL